MSTKNNPRNRGGNAAARMYDGKKVVPALYINADPKNKARYVAAQYENGDLVMDTATGHPVPFKDVPLVA